MPTNIEALQQERAQHTLVVARAAVLRRLLAVFDPQAADHALDYPGLLRRTREVIATALAHEEGAPDAS